MEKRQASLEEKLRTMLGSKSYGPTNAKDLCFSTGVTLPKDFKIPDLTKYSGTEDPIYHLTAYCVRMGVWSNDEKFLIQFFHESLIGPALQWYLQLDHSKIQSWQDLYDAFLSQYGFNLEIAPTREELHGMRKKDEESFREYAQRWRVKAAQVKPSLMGHEICSYFLKTLRAPYIQSMAGCPFNDFADIIKAGERVETLVHEGILQAPNEEKKNVAPKKKEGDANNIRSHPLPPPYPQNLPIQHSTMNYPNQIPSPYQVNNIPSPYYPPNPTSQPYLNYQHTFQKNYPTTQTSPQRPNNYPNQYQNRPQRNTKPFPNLGVSNSELYKQLHKAHLASLRPMKPLEPPYPRWYNPNLTCEYHMDAVGHSIEDCGAFKGLVMSLLDAKMIAIQDGNGPNVHSNPLPNHQGGGQIKAA